MPSILCFGDSNTYGYDPLTGLRYPEEVRWPRVLAGLLGDDFRVIEEGCNGRTASVTPVDEPWKDGRSYLKACLNSHKPIDRIVLMLGSNDLKEQFHASPESITGGIHEILQTIEEFLDEKQGFVPKVLLVSPPLIGQGIATSEFSDRFKVDAIDRSAQLACLYQEEAKAFDCDFLDAAKIVDPSDADSLHLMPEAHEALAKAIRKML